MVMIISKWFYPIFAVLIMLAFYLNDATSISPVGATLAMLLAFLGIGITERLDKIIKQNEKIVLNIEEVEENTRIVG